MKHRALHLITASTADECLHHTFLTNFIFVLLC